MLMHSGTPVVESPFLEIVRSHLGIALDHLL